MMKSYDDISREVDALRATLLEEEAMLCEKVAAERAPRLARIQHLKQQLAVAQEQLERQRLKIKKWKLYYIYMRYPMRNTGIALLLIMGFEFLIAGYIYGYKNCWALGVQQGIQEDYNHEARESARQYQHEHRVVK